ncbi:MAG TPA: antitoxin [Terriglobia bacterium]|nr:antitoxin [Terriglobia bacterium]
MRTTLNIEDGVLEKVKAYASDRSLGLGKAVSQLVRRGLAAQSATRTLNGLQVFDLPEDSPIVSVEDVRRLGDQEA